MKFFWKRKIQKNTETRPNPVTLPSPVSPEEPLSGEKIIGKKRLRDDEMVSPPCSPHTTKWYLWYTLVKVNLEQMDCCRRLSELLGISINHVTQAGIKDRRGYTIQRGCLIVDTDDKKLLKSLNLLSVPTSTPSCPSQINEAAMRTLSVVQERLLATNSDKMKAFLKSGTFDHGTEAPPNSSPSSLSPSESPITSSVDIGLAIGDIEFKEVGISPGDLSGNRFNILLRNVTLQTKDPVEKSQSLGPLDFVRDRLLALEQSGFPNFFGTQRMGIVSIEAAGSGCPLGPLIGKYLMTGNGTSAVYCILSGRDGGEKITIPTRLNEQSQDVEEDQDEEGEGGREEEDGGEEEAVEGPLEEVVDHVPILQARAMFLSGAPLTKVYRLLPQSLTRERKLVKNLIRYSPSRSTPTHTSADKLRILWEEACCAAIRGLPYTTKQLWLSSYQSWLWNKVVDYHLGMKTSDPSSSRAGVAHVGDVLLMDENKSSLRLLSVDDVQMIGETNAGAELVVIPMIGRGWTIYPENHVGR
jgi:tRNA(Glu) U13 pseudouridine synthase TruD